ncbi:MAG: LytTR family DNA-binding domain-containing protein [Saprospiraceae bacterium]|nr:LytTR family DNA-binding domain-containing protein [Saprospiraceae bacterium]
MRQKLRILKQQSEEEVAIIQLPVYKTKIAISMQDGLVIVPIEEITYCKAMSNYTQIMLRSGKQYMVSKTMKRFEEVLNPTQFIKVHQSFIVSIESIYKVSDGIILWDSTQIPISRSKKKRVQEIVKRYFDVV